MIGGVGFHLLGQGLHYSSQRKSTARFRLDQGTRDHARDKRPCRKHVWTTIVWPSNVALCLLCEAVRSGPSVVLIRRSKRSSSTSGAPTIGCAPWKTNCSAAMTLRRNNTTPCACCRAH